MNVVGLITEYNPFHKGHEYHITKAKELTGANHAVVIMSGNYVQRGTPAFMNKHDRTEIALKHGADLVLELPLPFSCSSAEYFALAAVSVLHKTGIVDSICFGAETDDLDLLKKIAYILPFRFISDLPFRIYSGSISINQGINNIIEAIIWTILFIIIGNLITKNALKKAVIQGG